MVFFSLLPYTTIFDAILPALFPTPDERSLHRTRGFDHPVQPVGDGGRRERAQRLALS